MAIFIHFDISMLFSFYWTLDDLYQLLIERVPQTLLAETNVHSFDVFNVSCSCAFVSCCNIPCWVKLYTCTPLNIALFLLLQIGII